MCSAGRRVGRQGAAVLGSRPSACSFEAVARIGDKTIQGVVIAPMGHWVASSKAQATPAALNPTAFADLGCAPSFSDNRVEVGKV